MNLNDEKGIKKYFILLSIKICIAIFSRVINQEDITNIVIVLIGLNYLFGGTWMSFYISRVLKIPIGKASFICFPIMFLEIYILCSIVFGFNVTFNYIKN